MITFWLGLGATLVITELISRRFYAIFAALAAFAVAGMTHFELIDSLLMQITAWSVASVLTGLLLRPLALKLFSDHDKASVDDNRPWQAEEPKRLIVGNSRKQQIDEDGAFIGAHARVVEAITESEPGRVQFGETSWRAITESGQSFAVGETVEIVRRDNISWIVKAPQEPEN